MSLYVLINIIIFLALIAILYVMQKKHIDFTFRVLGALIMGLALGFLLRTLYASNIEIINKDIQNKDVSNTYRIGSYETIGLDEYRAYLKLIKKNISYETLCRRRKHEIPKIDGICDLLCRTLCSKRESIVISAESYPADLVKSRLLKLHDGHVLYVLDCMSENTAHIRNIKKYILAALFNAPSTIDAYYEAKANELSNM